MAKVVPSPDALSIIYELRVPVGIERCKGSRHPARPPLPRRGNAAPPAGRAGENDRESPVIRAGVVNSAGLLPPVLTRVAW